MGLGKGKRAYGFFQPVQSVDDCACFEEGFCLCKTEAAGCAGDADDFSGEAELWETGFCAEDYVLGGWLGLGLEERSWVGFDGHGVV